jgi:ribosomal protein S12 methylthiotransferase
VAFITLGCPKNEVDTDRMRAAVASSSFSVTEDLEAADVVVVNTCSFITEATEESVNTVLSVASDWLPMREGRRVVVAGCMPSRYGADLAAEMPEVSAFVSVADEGSLLEVLERVTGVTCTTTPGPRRTNSGPSAYLQISDGCHRACAYCTIPTIRGPYVSRPLPDILAETAELVAAGAKEIVLIGQDITAYGRDLDSSERLADVVDAIARTDGVEWLRLMYAQPDGVTDELLSAMAAHENVCRYLDIPLQHADRDVLRAMRRSGSASELVSLVERIRSALPDVVLRTTLIAGFPGETRQQAQAAQRFVADVRFDYVGVFPYSQEDGTAAAAMPDQVPGRTRVRRAQKLRDIADEIGFEKALDLVGSELEVLVEGVDPDEGFTVGRWRGQAPEIDGIVVLDRGEPGQIVTARITDAFGYDLEGEVI